MEEFDMSPDSTVKAMVESGLRIINLLEELETDHSTAVLIRKLKEKATSHENT